MYAIVNTKTNKFLYSTDYRYHPPHQRTSNDQMLTFPDKQLAFIALKFRQCGKNCKVCVLKHVEIKRILESEVEE